MKTLTRFLTVALLLPLVSCGGFKVLKSFKADDREGIRDKNVLVVARAARPEVRKIFEDEFTDQLTKKGIKAVPSYTRFPDFDPARPPSEDERREIRDILVKEGYNAVVLSTLKDYQEHTRTIGEGGYDASVNYGYIDAPIYMGWGFYTYFYSPLAYSTEDIWVEESPDTITSRLYILETAAFNLDLEEEQQLIGMVRASIENPEDATSTARKYVSTVIKAVEKG